MRVFKTKYFTKWAKKACLSDKNLMKNVHEISNGLIDARLGSNLLKKRIAIGSQGKKSGARVILAYKKEEKIFFIFGFEKNARDNISENEHEALSIVGATLIKATIEEITKLKDLGEIIEIEDKENE